MSKRGSNSAKFIGGKSWKNGHVKSTLKAHLKGVREKNKKEYLIEAFNAVAVAFGFTPNAPYVEQYRKYFVALTNKFKQNLFLQNTIHFISYAQSNDIDGSMDNYVNQKYYLRDYTGKVENMSLDLYELSKKELIDKQSDFKKSNLPDEQKNLISAHIDFLICNYEIKKPADLKAKIEDYLALESQKKKNK